MEVTHTKPAPAPRPPTAHPAPARPLFPAESDTHLLDRFNALYKYRYTAITVFLLVMLGVLIRVYTTIPMYRATTSLLIDDERAASVAGFNATSTDYTQDPEPYYQTQLRILTGRELATRVAAKLKLETQPEFNGQGPRRTGFAH